MKIFKSLFAFHLFLDLPLIAFIWLFIWTRPQAQFWGDGTIIYWLLIFLFVYRPLICNLRLLANNKINRSEFWLNFIPFRVDKYWWFVFFNIDTQKRKVLEFKSLGIFYVLLFVPLIPVFIVNFTFWGEYTLTVLNFVFLFLYRPLICNLRLLANNKINQSEYWLNFIPFRVDWYYFWFLFFNIETSKA